IFKLRLPSQYRDDFGRFTNGQVCCLIGAIRWKMSARRSHPLQLTQTPGCVDRFLTPSFCGLCVDATTTGEHGQSKKPWAGDERRPSIDGRGPATGWPLCKIPECVEALPANVD